MKHTYSRIEIPVEVGLHEGNPTVRLADTSNGVMEYFLNSIFAFERLPWVFLALLPFECKLMKLLAITSL